jgi:hypothetical protein
MIEAAIIAFIERLDENICALQREFGVQDLVTARKAGTLPRRGAVGRVPFLFHGKGLRFELEDDRVVDVDFCEGGLEVDWWRFQQFLAPLDKRSLVNDWFESYLLAYPAANARATTIAGRRLIWTE